MYFAQFKSGVKHATSEAWDTLMIYFSILLVIHWSAMKLKIFSLLIKYHVGWTTRTLMSFWSCLHYRWPLRLQKFKTFSRKYWPKLSDQMIKYIFHILKNYFGQYGQTILATTKTLRFYSGHNGLPLPAKIRTELFFTCQNSQNNLAKKFLGDLLILQWPVWSDQSDHCKIHLNWLCCSLLELSSHLTSEDNS